MDIQTIQDILNKQRKFFQSGETLPIKFRIEMLKKLYNSIIKHEKEKLNGQAAVVGYYIYI